jgi:hypothetical protein
MNIGDKIELRNCFSNGSGEYELVDIDEYRNHRFKKGRNIHIITEQALKYLGINNKEGENMNFIEAVKLLKLDNTIKLRRRNKDFEITYGLIGLNLTITDILAEDWYVVKNEKLCSFEDALKAYKSGKSIKRKGDDTIYRYETYCEFDRYDVLANDWVILDKEETK